MLADALWQAHFMQLVLYDHSTDTRLFYSCLGMVGKSGQATMMLDEIGLNALEGT